jgi:hypothetical protein
MLIGLSLLVLLVASVPSFAAGGPWGDYWRNYVTTGGNTATSANWFDTTTSQWIPTGSSSDNDAITVDAYIELYCSKTQETTAAFHWGQPPFHAQTAALKGTLVENHPCWIGISCPGWTTLNVAEKAHNLVFDPATSYAGAHPNSDGTMISPTGDTIANIPISWKLAFGGNEYALDENTGLNQSFPGLYSAGRMPVGVTPYEIRITATPAEFQGDGHYSMDPNVFILPDM